MGHAGMSRFPPHLYLERTAADRLDERHSGSSPREVLKQAVFGFLSDHGDPSDLVEESAVSLMMKGRCDSVGPQNGATVELSFKPVHLESELASPFIMHSPTDRLRRALIVAYIKNVPHTAEWTMRDYHKKAPQRSTTTAPGPGPRRGVSGAGRRHRQAGRPGTLVS
ncbi:unnamed protein product [Arctogadus glacialis]